MRVQVSESLRQQYDKEIKEASSTIADLYFRNPFVTRYWSRLVSRQGCIRELVEQAEAGCFPAVLPAPQELAASIDGWSRIPLSSQTHILRQLSKCLDHLRTAASLHNVLHPHIQMDLSVLRSDEIMATIRHGEAVVEKLANFSCPSLAGYTTVIRRLQTLIP
jgi:hypothetical protein